MGGGLGYLQWGALFHRQRCCTFPCQCNWISLPCGLDLTLSIAVSLPNMSTKCLLWVLEEKGGCPIALWTLASELAYVVVWQFFLWWGYSIQSNCPSQFASHSKYILLNRIEMIFPSSQKWSQDEKNNCMALRKGKWILGTWVGGWEYWWKMTHFCHKILGHTDMAADGEHMTVSPLWFTYLLVIFKILALSLFHKSHNLSTDPPPGKHLLPCQKQW